MTTPPRAATRRLYLDWLRGVAVLVMILWHSIDSWTRLDVRETPAFAVIIFLAGWAAPLFLFLAGVSVPLAGAARMARGLDRAAVSRGLQRRGWEIFLLAHLFRFQSFLLNPNGTWNGLFKPDILNILGLSLVAAAYLWGRARSTRQLAWFVLVPSIVIAVVLTPLAPTWWWPTLLNLRVEGYIRVANNNAVFSLFPASVYLLVGMLFGALTVGHPESDVRFQRQTAAWSAALFCVSAVVGLVPWPHAVSFWTAPVAVVAWRIGTMVLASVGAWRWLRFRPAPRSSLLIIFGRTSLFVYWVHVELAYGNLSFPLHHALTLPWSLAAYAALTAFMFVCATWWAARPVGQPIVPPHMSATIAGPGAAGGLRRHPVPD